MVPALIFIAGRIRHFLPSSTRVELFYTPLSSDTHNCVLSAVSLQWRHHGPLRPVSWLKWVRVRVSSMVVKNTIMSQPNILKDPLFLAPVLSNDARFRKLICCAKSRNETLEKRRTAPESLRKTTGWILRSVSVFLTVQPVKPV